MTTTDALLAARVAPVRPGLPTAADTRRAERARQEAEDEIARAAERAIVVAIAARDGGGEGEDDDDDSIAGTIAKIVLADAVFRRLSRGAAVRVGESARSQIDESLLTRDPDLVERLDAVDATLDDDLSRSLARAAGERASRDSVDVLRETVQDIREKWSRQVARTFATRLSSEGANRVAEAVAQVLRVALSRLWITRGDSRVRGAHRRLHGETRAGDKPFWRELGTGRQLRWPGDSDAPPEMTYNCRCVNFFVPQAQAGDASEAFEPSGEWVNEAMAASLITHLDDAESVAGHCDASLALVSIIAAPWRREDEEKHERDRSGKFAKKDAATGNDRFDREAWLREGGWDALRAKYPSLSKKGGKGGSGSKKGGSSGGDPNDPVKKAREAEKRRREAKQRQIDERAERYRIMNATEREGLRRASQDERDRTRDRREDEDAELDALADEAAETEAEARKKRLEAERAAAELRQMRIRGDDAGLIARQRGRVDELNGEADKLYEASREIGDRKTVTALRQQVRRSRVIEDRGRRDAWEKRRIAARTTSKSRADEIRQLRVDARAISQDEQAKISQLVESRRKKPRRASAAPDDGDGDGGDDSFGGVAILALKTGDDVVEYSDGDSAPMHCTLAYFGDADELDDDMLFELSEVVESLASEIQPFTAEASGPAKLGPHQEDVCIVQSHELTDAYQRLRAAPVVQRLIYESMDSQHPSWIPHVSGLEAEPGEDVAFDRLALHIGGERHWFELGTGRAVQPENVDES